MENIFDIDKFNIIEDESNEGNSKLPVQKFIETLEKLQEIGVDVSKLQARDTIKTLAEKSEISESELKKVGLNPSDNIGNRISYIKSVYRYKIEETKPTEEQVKMLLELGIDLERKGRKRNVTQEFIETLEKLQEIGVDVSKVQQKDTIKTLAEKSEINESELKKVGLKPNDNIGIRRSNIRGVYNGRRKGTKPTEKQVKMLLELGIDLERKVRKGNVTQEFIETLEELQEMGVDVSKLTAEDTIKTLAEKSGVSESELKKVGLKPNDNIGMRRSSIRGVYNGRRKGTKPTEEQVKMLLELGIDLERKGRKVRKRNVTQELIEILEKLQEIGVDVSKVQRSDTIKTLAKISGVSESELKNVGLNPSDNIGNRISYIKSVYRYKREGTKPTEEQVKMLLELGIDLERKGRKVRKGNVTQELIETLEKLQEIGVDVSKLKTSDTIKTLAKISGVSESELKNVGLNPSDNIGNRISYIKSVYRYKREGTKTTEEQVKMLLELGIDLGRKRNVTQEFIETLEELQEMGVDVSKLTAEDTIKTLAEKSGVSESELKKVGLKPNDNIGMRRSSIRGVYNGRRKGTKPTEEQVRRLLELGISLEKKKRTSKEIAQASISSLTDIEMADREDKALQELVEKTKERGVKQNEQS